MTRDEGIKMVEKYDHVKPSDLKRWLEYVDMTENEFDLIADKFRDPEFGPLKMVIGLKLISMVLNNPMAKLQLKNEKISTHSKTFS